MKKITAEEINRLVAIDAYIYAEVSGGIVPDGYKASIKLENVERVSDATEQDVQTAIQRIADIYKTSTDQVKLITRGECYRPEEG